MCPNSLVCECLGEGGGGGGGKEGMGLGVVRFNNNNKIRKNYFTLFQYPEKPSNHPVGNSPGPLRNFSCSTFVNE